MDTKVLPPTAVGLPVQFVGWQKLFFIWSAMLFAYRSTLLGHRESSAFCNVSFFDRSNFYPSSQRDLGKTLSWYVSTRLTAQLWIGVAGRSTTGSGADLGQWTSGIWRPCVEALAGEEFAVGLIVQDEASSASWSAADGIEILFAEEKEDRDEGGAKTDVEDGGGPGSEGLSQKRNKEGVIERHSV